ncbi:hypothetical protein EYF80_050930 [Liparis tanakae]|uniref:Uncharacterized protein n=1 Tax=Liparis tanakae TaxID=230148 RepID=A0A4Z2FDB4_9TELE|nr:hypothetical protein EYF80_050930 [Liparis tanakae]
MAVKCPLRYGVTHSKAVPPRRTHFEKVVSQLANDKNSAPSSPFLLGTMTTERIPALAAARIINRQEYDRKNTDMHILDKWKKNAGTSGGTYQVAVESLRGDGVIAVVWFALSRVHKFIHFLI